VASRQPFDPTDAPPPAGAQQAAEAGFLEVPSGADLALPAIRGVPEAILHAIIYADLFDYPLTVEEIHRYLPAHCTPLAAVQEELTTNQQLGERLSSSPPYWFLVGRDHLVEVRREREAFSQDLWPLAWHHAHSMAAMPFIRLVALTGSLTMNNVTSAGDDVDFLIVAQRGRVWLARALVISVVHLAQRAGLELCPNYVIAHHTLQLGEPSLFTAHELAQIVPLYGRSTYQQLLDHNRWTVHFLPNASPRPDTARDLSPQALRRQRILERLLAGRLGDALERWERDRKIPRLRLIAQQQGSANALYTPDLCKGHVNDHASDIRQRYAEQLRAEGMRQ
jgi:hypothetical protein